MSLRAIGLCGALLWMFGCGSNSSSDGLARGSGGLAGAGEAGASDGASDSGTASGGSSSYGDWSLYGCLDEKAHVFGTLNDAPFDVAHDVRSVRTDALSSLVQFGVTGDGAQAWLQVVWAKSPTAGAAIVPKHFRVRLEAPDPMAGVELCADGESHALREGNRVGGIAHRLVSLQCPGTPVSGSLDLADASLSGSVDGASISVMLADNAANGNGRSTQWVSTANGEYQLLLDTDDATGMASGGQVTGGRFEIAAPLPEQIYCVSAASFTRTASGAASVHLTGLSKIGSCVTAPSLGTLRFCAQSALVVQP